LKKLFILVFLFINTILIAQVSVGVRIGPPPPPRVIAIQPTPPPGPGYVWVEGYWYPVGRHYKWHEGYWTLPPYPAARWIPPRYEGGLFFEGYWDGDRGRFPHDHHWDRDHHRRDGERFEKHDRDDRHR
jgi:hypothetical protein